MPLPAWAIRAGARETIYYNPSEVLDTLDATIAPWMLPLLGTPAQLWHGTDSTGSIPGSNRHRLWRVMSAA